MTPQEKARELVDKMYNEPIGIYMMCFNIAKQCALIAVDELLNNFLSNRNTKYGKERYFFWQQVKQEIQKL
jgi:hypothetical protein